MVFIVDFVMLGDLLYVQRVIDMIMQILPDKFQAVLTYKSRVNGCKTVFSQDSPPISIIKVGGVSLSTDSGLAVGSESILCFSSRESVRGVNPILHYIAHAASFLSIWPRCYCVWTCC